MKIIVGKNSGFCYGVKNAVNISMNNASHSTYCFGEIIHNDYIIKKLQNLGVRTVSNLDDVPENSKVIIRSHGVGKDVYDKCILKNLSILDATCPFVANIHKIVQDYFSRGYHIVIIGDPMHPEVEGINGWCNHSATIIGENYDADELKTYEKLCFVVQTTFSVKKYKEIIKKIQKDCFKTVDIFDTICYTTNKRQAEAEKISKDSDLVIVIGNRNSSNTTKLYDLCKKFNGNTYHIESVDELKMLNLKYGDKIGIIAGASTPEELIMEVKGYMSQQFEEVQNQEFIDGVEESLVNYKVGKRIKGTVISADEKGIHVRIGGKKDGLIYSDEVVMEGVYNPDDFKPDTEIEALILSNQDPDSGCVLLSKKKIDLIKEGDKQVETIRNGEIFELAVEKDTKGGLLAKMGTYTVFIPASQIKESFVKDLKPFKGKKLRLTAIEIDDAKHKIVASQRKVLEAERLAKEEIFWTNVKPNVVVHGKVKRVTDFGAFVSVDGFDCLAHIVDLSWSHIKSVEEVLTIGQSYDFLVLSVDREKGRVSLGYKQLQFIKAMEQHPIDSILKGKVVSIVPFGAFVEIEPGIEGLVHVSEAAHSYVKNINEIVKVGDEVDVKVLHIDDLNRKITLSIKACLPEEERPVYNEENRQENRTSDYRPERKPNKKFSKVENDDQKEWSEDSAYNPFADLLKDLDVK